MAQGEVPTVRVGTLNVRNTADRWRARRDLLVAQLVELAPHVIGVQELRRVPGQAGWIVAAVERASGGRLRYQCHGRAKTGPAGLWEGIGVLTRLPVVATAWLDLGSQTRVAQAVTVRMADGVLLDVYNTHLGLGGEVLRTAQAERLLHWMSTRAPLPAVLVGDCNARPGSPTIECFATRLRSAHAEVHGHEPTRTAPTPLRRRPRPAPGASPAGTGSVLDYVFVNDLVEVVDARVAFDQLDPADATLCASDHFGITATIRVRRPLPAGA